MPFSQWVPYVVMGVAAAIWVVATWRKGRRESGDLWKDEVEALEKRTKRLEAELKEERDKSRHLEGRVEQLTLDNHNLQALALGELPKALENTLVTMGDRIIRRMEESEDRISQGVLHMADAISKVMGQVREDLDTIKSDVNEIKRSGTA